MFGLAFTQMIDSALIVAFQALSDPAVVETADFASETGFQSSFAAIIEATPMHIKAIILLVDLIPITIFALFGFFANKYKKWAYIAGLALFGIDTLLFLMIGDFLGLAIHVFALFSIFKAYKALKDAEKSQQWEADLNSQPLETEYETI